MKKNSENKLGKKTINKLLTLSIQKKNSMSFLKKKWYENIKVRNYANKIDQYKEQLKNNCKSDKNELLTKLDNIKKKNQVLSIEIQFQNKKEQAIIDTGSNISCIEYSFIKNKNLITPEKQTTITRADNSILENMDTIQLKINILGTEYEINAYVIKDLTYEILLGNNFCLKYNVVIDFNNKVINFKTGDSIKMDKIWVEYNGVSNSGKRENVIGKIIVTRDIFIPPKVITRNRIFMQ